MIGLYAGPSKPANFNDLLRPFVLEMIDLINNGFDYQGLIIKISLIMFVCDAPARALIKATKSHTGYCACERCTVDGDFVGDHVVFLEINCSERTNESFRNRVHAEHHKGDSILELLPNLDMIKCFPLDSMHLVFLGVIKKFAILSFFHLLYLYPYHLHL